MVSTRLIEDVNYMLVVIGLRNQNVVVKNLRLILVSLLVIPSTFVNKVITATKIAIPTISLSDRGFVSPVEYYDVHLYYSVDDPASLQSATELHKTLAILFPDMPIYPMVNRPIGPHPKPMFETHLMTPAQFGKVLSWLSVNRGEHSVLVHPHTGDGYQDHAHHAIWLGPQLPLRLDIFSR